MKIACLVKCVPAASAEFGFGADLTLARDRLDGQLSELDEYAVEQAVRLAEAGRADRVIHVTMGPGGAEDAVRKALAIGGDEGVHILDDALHGCDAPGTARVLAAAVKRLGADLVLCGMGSTDAEMSVVPSMVADLLALPELAFAAELAVEGGTVRVTRHTDRAIERVEAPLPALVSITDQAGQARYPTFKTIVAARRKPIRTWSAVELGVDPGRIGLGGAATVMLGVGASPPRAAATIITGGEGAASALADFLAGRNLLPHS
ncbi:MAG TPA: electron transfer flavoprotein subunit beta/FixA family protein [Actinocrinis sp.]|nr:electron transfer flavoprotein subunit beta/FixA family protein [Actinocrinis sp.]